MEVEVYSWENPPKKWWAFPASHAWDYQRVGSQKRGDDAFFTSRSFECISLDI